MGLGFLCEICWRGVGCSDSTLAVGCQVAWPQRMSDFEIMLRNCVTAEWAADVVCERCAHVMRGVLISRGRICADEDVRVKSVAISHITRVHLQGKLCPFARKNSVQVLYVFSFKLPTQRPRAD